MFGKLVKLVRIYKYDKSKQPWKRVDAFHAFFCKDNETILGRINGEPYTYDIWFRKYADIVHYFKQNGYSAEV